MSHDDYSPNEAVYSPLETLRHSAAHVLADAVWRLFPGVQLVIGPAISSGFYYDFDLPAPLSEDELPKIESEINKILKEDLSFIRKEVSKSEALKIFEEKGQTYKVEILKNIPDNEVITIYQHGHFFDLCRGPHVSSTKQIGAVKLLSVAGAYFKGDSKNKMLSRVYGTAFPTQAELTSYLEKLEQTRLRDHRKLAKELELIYFDPLAPGCPFFLPKGMILWTALSDWMRKMLLLSGYVEVKTPLIFNQQLWETSGHLQAFRENMFMINSEEQSFALKPMNCPSHMLIYRSKNRSYRELPLRIHDQGILHRAEASGTLSGLTRVRQFCQDDGHIFLRANQVEAEIANLLQLIDKIYKIFGLSYQVKLSTRNPEKIIGDSNLWDKAEADLKQALDILGIQYTVEPGEGAFYGPKIDFDVTDSLDRKWQCATIQLDFQLPRRFGLSYVDENNTHEIPVVIHRAILGSFERFIAILIEHYAGAFPLWLSPVQAKILPVSQKHNEYAQKVHNLFQQRGVRVESDLSNEKLGAKIRKAQLEKTPYMIVLGDKEASSNEISARTRQGEQLPSLPLNDLIEKIYSEGIPPTIN